MSETKPKSFGVKLKQFIKSAGIITLILIALFIFFTFMSKKFLTPNNMYNLTRAASIQGIAALGMSICIYVGGIDLTIGSMIGVVTMIIAGLTTTVSGPAIIEFWPLTLPIVLVFGIGIGILSGILINDGGMPPYIVTLSWQMILRAMCQLISNGNVLEKISEGYKTLATSATDIFGIPLMAFVWAVLIVFTWIMLNHMRVGRNIYAVGANAETARLSGISLRRTRCFAWGYSAFLSVVAGILMGARIRSGMPQTATGYEADCIASSVIGGASFSGGEGSVVGTTIGVLILQTLRNGANLLGWNTFIIEMVIGALIVISVLIDGKGKRRES